MSRRLILDSHVFLWLLQEPHKVGMGAKAIIKEAPESHISLATIWELGIKHQKGKLAFSAAQLLPAVDKLGMDVLDIADSHIVSATSLRISHKDPFDRMLLAQAKVEKLVLITADTELLRLGLDFVIDARK